MLDEQSPRMTAFKTTVQTHFSLLNRIANSVSEKLNEITIDTKKYDIRVKRGLINGIGTIFKSITGNLDSSDGEYFNECIDRVSHDEREIEYLLKSQISVTSSAIRTFNSTIQNLQIDEENFNRDLVDIQNSLKDISDTLAFYESQIKTLNICELLMESYVYLESALDDISNSITFARLNILHSSIITPIDLITALQEISRSLTKNNLPLKPYSSSVAQYLDLIELKAYQTDDKVVFVLKIPLIEPETYTLYRLFPIPILDNRTGFHHLIPTTLKYIARDDDSLLYIKPKDPNSCKQVRVNFKICSDLLQYPIDNEAICEAQLFRQFNKLPSTCQTSIMLASDYNVQELSINYWLISISHPLPASVKCGTRELVTNILKTNSLLKLQPDCSAFIGSTRIRSKSIVHQKYKNVTYNDHPVTIPFDCCPHIPEGFHVPDLKPLKLNKIDVEDLNVAQHKLNQYSEELEKLIKQPFIKKHVHWLTITSITLVILLVTVYLACKCARRKPGRLSIQGFDDPHPPPKPESRRLLPSHIRKLIPKRRTSIHPEDSIQEEAL